MEGAQLCTWKIPSAKNELWGHILKWHFQSCTIQLLSLCVAQSLQRSLSWVNLLHKNKENNLKRRWGNALGGFIKPFPSCSSLRWHILSLSEFWVGLAWILSKPSISRRKYLGDSAVWGSSSWSQTGEWFDPSYCGLFEFQGFNDPRGALLSWFCAVLLHMNNWGAQDAQRHCDIEVLEFLESSTQILWILRYWAIGRNKFLWQRRNFSTDFFASPLWIAS